jgi:hypothetical protein
MQRNWTEGASLSPTHSRPGHYMKFHGPPIEVWYEIRGAAQPA